MGFVRLNADTWRYEDGGVRFFLLCGETRAALIDTGMNAPVARALAEALTPLPLILVNTHADPDHISGNGAFESFYMSPAEEENYRAHGGRGTLQPVREGDAIELGGRTLRVIDIPGHTPGSIALLDEKYRVLYAGDSVQNGNIFMFGKFRDIKAYAASLAHLSEYAGAFDAVYPCHGAFPVESALIGQLIEGAKQIIGGEAAGKPVEVHGTAVCLYKFPYAGFLCDIPPSED